ncbi:MAG: hypothetical protein ACREQR_02750 [Candidatus Binataceae bacterium]
MHATDGSGVAVGFGDGLAVRVGVGPAVAVAVGCGVGLTVGVRFGVGVTVGVRFGETLRCRRLSDRPDAMSEFGVPAPTARAR